MLGFAARQYQVFTDRLDKKHPRFRLCPTECEENGFNDRRTKKCDLCPVKELEDLFKDETLELWRQTLGDKADKYTFEQVLSSLYKAIRFQELPPERMTVYQHGLVTTYLKEKNLHKAKKDFEEAEKRKTA